MKCSFLIDLLSITFSALKKLSIPKTDHTFLNASNTPSSFSNDLQTAEKLYFTHDREQIFTDESDSDENESSNSEEEPDNSIESLGPEIEWTECDINDRQKVESYMNKGCGCLHGSEGKSCSKHYSVEQVLEHRQICLEMTSSELDRLCLHNLTHALDKMTYLSPVGNKEKGRGHAHTVHFEVNLM